MLKIQMDVEARVDDIILIAGVEAGINALRFGHTAPDRIEKTESETSDILIGEDAQLCSGLEH